MRKTPADSLALLVQPYEAKFTGTDVQRVHIPRVTSFKMSPHVHHLINTNVSFHLLDLLSPQPPFEASLELPLLPHPSS
jgi:hypothetical protein